MNESQIDLLEELLYKGAIANGFEGDIRNGVLFTWLWDLPATIITERITWKKGREVHIIRSGGIHYKQADIHEVSAEVIDDMAIAWSRIMLLAVVGGNEVTNPFMVTEVYKKQDGIYRKAPINSALFFSQLENKKAAKTEGSTFRQSDQLFFGYKLIGFANLG